MVKGTSASLPNWLRGFDSRRPLRASSQVSRGANVSQTAGKSAGCTHGCTLVPPVDGSRLRVARLLLALVPAVFGGVVLGALVVGVPWWLVGLVSLGVMVAAIACEVRAAGDGEPQASGWDASDRPAATGSGWLGPDEVASFRDELWKAGLTDEQRDAAVEVLPFLLGRWQPWEAAQALSMVVNVLGIEPGQMECAAMVAKHLADFGHEHPRR